jgi:hypothetical protein
MCGLAADAGLRESVIQPTGIVPEKTVEGSKNACPACPFSKGNPVLD